jgi:hypothetical protein
VHVRTYGRYKTVRAISINYSHNLRLHTELISKKYFTFDFRLSTRVNSNRSFTAHCKRYHNVRVLSLHPRCRYQRKQQKVFTLLASPSFPTTVPFHTSNLFSVHRNNQHVVIDAEKVLHHCPPVGFGNYSIQSCCCMVVSINQYMGKKCHV